MASAPRRLHPEREILPPPRPRTWRWLLRGAETVARGLGRKPGILPIHALGAQGEDLAYWALREHGYTVVARNTRRLAGEAAPEGELDLIAYEGSPPALVFVEVKTRTREGEIGAEGAVDARKREHLVRLARAYRRRRGLSGPYRFDVVVVYGPQERAPHIELHRGAIQG